MKNSLYIFKRKVTFAVFNFIASLNPRGKKNILYPLSIQPRLLFVVNGLIGDTIMSTSAIIAARKIWPFSYIAVLGKKSNIDILYGLKEINIFKDTGYMPFSIKRSFSGAKLLDWIRKENFDASIILLGDDFAKILYQANIPVRVGVLGSPMKATHTHLYYIKSPRECSPQERLNALRCMGYSPYSTKPTIENDHETLSMKDLIFTRMGIPEVYFIIHPFGSTCRQWWRTVDVPSLAENIFQLTGIKSVLIGGSETQNERIVSSCLIDTRGKLSLKELKLLISQAKMVISTDSGPFHIAGGFKKPLIGLFRSIRPELSNIYQGPKIIFGQHESCKNECSWDYCNVSPCRQMQEIKIEAILNTIQLYLIGTC